MAAERPRLGKAKKRARLAMKQARKLVKKHRNKVDPAKIAEIEQAVAQVDAGMGARDVVAIYDGLKVLEDRVSTHMGTLRKSPTREYIESIAFAVGVALLLRAFVIEAFTIPSGSMIPTLAVGDFLFVNKLSYGVRLPFTNKLVAQWSEPERGDVIVFVFPCDQSLDYIKRVVGLPGDVIDVDVERGFVQVNGDVVGEEYLGPFEDFSEFNSGQMSNCRTYHRYLSHFGDQSLATLHCSAMQPGVPEGRPVPADWSNIPDYRRCDFRTQPAPAFPWKVPEGHVFVMGDNRQNSEDSRYWGFVPYGLIKGKAMFLWLSWDGAASWSKPWEKIRWNRMFRGVHREVER